MNVLFLPGITKLRFKPAYNPYTEPSMEVFSYHEGTPELCVFICSLYHQIFIYIYAEINIWSEQDSPIQYIRKKIYIGINYNVNDP